MYRPEKSLPKNGKPEQSGLLPQFGTTSIQDDGGRKAGFAHVNPTTGTETHDLHP